MSVDATARCVHSEHRVEGGELGFFRARVRQLRCPLMTARPVLDTSAPDRPFAKDHDVEAVIGVQERIAGGRCAPFPLQPTGPPCAVVLVGSLTFASACEVFLHMAGADAADPQHLGVAIVLQDVNKADETGLAHFAEMFLLLQFLDIDATPALVRHTGLCPLPRRCSLPDGSDGHGQSPARLSSRTGTKAWFVSAARRAFSSRMSRSGARRDSTS